MKLEFPIECRVKSHGKISVPEQGCFVFCDPCYANKEDDWLAAFALTDWSEEASLFIIEDDQGTRAIVLTDGSELPKPLLETKLRGKHVFQGSVGVDTAAIGIYSMDYEPLTPEPFRTWIGDGIYPLAFWGRDGYVYAVAVLCDLRYYAEGW